MESSSPFTSISEWKKLDMTAQYAQINTLRKLQLDIGFYTLHLEISRLICSRVNSMKEDLTTLFEFEIVKIAPVTDVINP